MKITGTDLGITLENERLAEVLRQMTARKAVIFTRVMIPLPDAAITWWASGVKERVVIPSWCSHCRARSTNREHLCLVYDGEPCVTCGEPTITYSVGAPGYGCGILCRAGHDVPLTPQGVYEPWEVE